jgi:type IV pilus assembly protein PilB
LLEEVTVQDPALSRMLIRPLIGELLMRSGCIGQAQLRAALDRQRLGRRRLGVTLVELGFVAEGALVEALSRQLHVPVVDLDTLELLPDTMCYLSSEMAFRHRVIPVRAEEAVPSLLVATADPTNLRTLDELTSHCGRMVTFALSGEHAIRRALRRCYGAWIHARS